MADWRKLYRETWGKRRILQLCRDARLMFIGWVTLQDDHGYLDGDPQYLKANIFPGDDDVTAADCLKLRDEVLDAKLGELWETEDGDPVVFLPDSERFQGIRFDRRKESQFQRKSLRRRSDGETLTSCQSREIERERDKRQRDKERAAAPPSVENLNQSLIKAVILSWQKAFPNTPLGSDPDKTARAAQKLLNLAQHAEADPTWRIRLWAERRIDRPYAYAMRAMGGNRDDGEPSYHQFVERVT